MATPSPFSPFGRDIIRFLVLMIFLALVDWIVSERGTAAEGRKSDSHLGKVRHVVLFKFKDGTTAEKKKTVDDARQ
ncbi:MAG: hypothetical protein ABSG53_12140 [Thermoguttaceae bacterium]